jgi:hypothetical protein
MGNVGRSLVAVLTTALAAVVGRSAAAQWTPAFWVDLVQMPVAVARLELAGVPIADLRLLVPSLNARGISPTLFIESVRGIRLLDGWDSGRKNRDTPGMGGYVRRLHDVGLRGSQLAGAIERELRTRGVPAGPRSGHGSDVFSRGFLPADFESSSGPAAPGRPRGALVRESAPSDVERGRPGLVPRKADGTPRGRGNGDGAGVSRGSSRGRS